MIPANLGACQPESFYPAWLYRAEGDAIVEYRVDAAGLTAVGGLPGVPPADVVIQQFFIGRNLSALALPTGDRLLAYRGLDPLYAAGAFMSAGLFLQRFTNNAWASPVQVATGQITYPGREYLRPQLLRLRPGDDLLLVWQDNGEYAVNQQYGTGSEALAVWAMHGSWNGTDWTWEAAKQPAIPAIQSGDVLADLLVEPTEGGYLYVCGYNGGYLRLASQIEAWPTSLVDSLGLGPASYHHFLRPTSEVLCLMENPGGVLAAAVSGYQPPNYGPRTAQDAWGAGSAVASTWDYTTDPALLDDPRGGVIVLYTKTDGTIGRVSGSVDGRTWTPL